MTQPVAETPPQKVDYASPKTRTRRPTPLWLKRLGKAFLVAFILTILFHAGWSIYAGHQLRAFLAQCSAAGEPVTPAQFQPPIPDSQNAAIRWRAAVTALAKNTRAFDELGWLDLAPPLRDGEMVTIHTALDENATVLARAAEASALSQANWNLRFIKPYIHVLLPDLNDQRELTMLLSASVLEVHHRGDDADALTRARWILRQSDAVDQMPMMVSHLVAIAISHSAAERLQQIAPTLHIIQTTPGSTPGPAHAAQRADVLVIIADLLDETRMRDGLKLGFYSDRLVTLDLADDWAQVMSTRTTWDRVVQRATNYAVAPTARQDGIRIVQHGAGVLRAAVSSTDFFAFKASAPRPVTFSVSPLHPVAFMQSDSHRFVKTHYRVLTERRLAAAALAIRLYAIEHEDQFPASLNDLVPQYLPAVPIDPFAPGPQLLRYDPHRAIVYSLGDNGADDGGSEKSSREDPDHWDMLDAVVHLHTPPRKPPSPRPQRNDFIPSDPPMPAPVPSPGTPGRR